MLICNLSLMSMKEFVSQQRNTVNFLFGLFVAGLLMFWLWAALAWAFALGWNADPKILWAAPLMAIFGYGVRFFCMKIFRFVESYY